MEMIIFAIGKVYLWWKQIDGVLCILTLLLFVYFWEKGIENERLYIDIEWRHGQYDIALRHAGKDCFGCFF